MTITIKDQLFSSLIVQDIAFFDGTTSGELNSRLGTDTNRVVAPFQTALSTFLSSTISLFGGLVMALYVSWKLSLLAFTTIGPVILLFRMYASFSRVVSRQIWAAYGDAASYATQAFSNIRTVRAFSQEDKELAKYKSATSEALRKAIKDAIVGAGTFALTNYLDLAVGVLLLFYGGSVAMEEDSDLSVGALITFQLYWNMINSSYTSLTNVLTSFTRAGGAAQRVISLMDSRPDIDPHAGHKVTRQTLQGDIELQDIHFHYQMRPDNKVLKGVSLKIAQGKTCALVGRSGGGKSTLIHLLMRFYDPRKGRIMLDGKDLRTYSPLSLRQNIGIVSQDTQLFDTSIRDNISYGVDDATDDDIIRAAKMANAHEFIRDFEEGYETRVGDRGVRLSGGQKQRIAIARVMLRRPKLLFLDEATSSLDAESEALVQEAIDKLLEFGDCTVVLVAHRLSTVVNADVIAVVNNGEIAETGTHEELLEEGGIYAKLVHRQVYRMQNTLKNDDAAPDPVDVIDKLLEKED
eukprot:TRINITY_DN2169_c0_g2_i2.p1 TRINITY_DN2169_c0_g2~~TRINITY_DN2169_c0_g2_i2.p1  ORF type:complete len:607 (-),score=91.41 TRINITY_DN2169_c0_g2_i2:35-1597(-)